MAVEETIDSRRIYAGRILSLRVDSVRLANGQETKREIVEHGEAVAIVPVHADGEVMLVRQFRKPVEQALLEIPAGGIEPGEEPAEAARRELQEETGLMAGRLQHLTTFYTTPGFSTEVMHLFLATELTNSRLPADDDEDIEIVRMPIDRALGLAVNGPASDAKTLVGLLMARSMTTVAGHLPEAHQCGC